MLLTLQKHIHNPSLLFAAQQNFFKAQLQVIDEKEKRGKCL